MRVSNLIYFSELVGQVALWCWRLHFHREFNKDLNDLDLVYKLPVIHDILRKLLRLSFRVTVSKMMYTALSGTEMWMVWYLCMF